MYSKNGGEINKNGGEINMYKSGKEKGVTITMGRSHVGPTLRRLFSPTLLDASTRFGPRCVVFSEGCVLVQCG